MLLEAGCSVVVADLRLRPEAEATLSQYPHPSSDPSKPSATFWPTDISDWTQISSLWKTALEAFSRIDIVISCAGVYEPPSSSFWNPPGISPLAEDPEDAKVGQYKSFAINTIGPIRLSQIAIDYWQQNPTVEGNLLFVASMGGYMHSMQTPLYFASKAALVSMVKSLGGLKTALGIRNAAVCPGAVFVCLSPPTFLCYTNIKQTPIFEQDYCRDRLRPGDIALEPEDVAELAMRVLQKPQYGDGNIMEILMVGSKEEQSVNVREITLEALYPTVSPLGAGTRAMTEELKFFEKVKEKGMRSNS
jgi:NAD(P)-dependent dehydrogenase (short-subunit alcohol dehydrogenase family)